MLALISNEMLFEAVSGLPAEQRDCILMRFIQGPVHRPDRCSSGARPEGAVKQLQLRAVRSLTTHRAGETFGEDDMSGPSSRRPTP